MTYLLEVEQRAAGSEQPTTDSAAQAPR